MRHRNLLKNGPHFRELWTRDDRNARLDNSRLFGGNLFQGTAEPFLVIQVDGSQHRNQRMNDIGGVQPATESSLKDHEINAMASKIVKSQRRRNFKECWMMVFVNARADPLDSSNDVCIID